MLVKYRLRVYGLNGKKKQRENRWICDESLFCETHRRSEETFSA